MRNDPAMLIPSVAHGNSRGPTASPMPNLAGVPSASKNNQHPSHADHHGHQTPEGVEQGRPAVTAHRGDQEVRLSQQGEDDDRPCDGYYGQREEHVCAGFGTARASAMASSTRRQRIHAR